MLASKYFNGLLSKTSLSQSPGLGSLLGNSGAFHTAASLTRKDKRVLSGLLART